MINSGSKRIAERYGKALLDTATAARALDAVEQDMGRLAQAYAQSTEFRALLANPLLTRAQLEKMMDALVSGLHMQEITQQFVRLLARQRRLTLLSAIAEYIAEAAASARGEMMAEVVSSQKMNAPQLDAIAQKLSKLYDRKIIVHASQDPSLLGGFLVRVGSTQLDASLNGKLQRLSNKLKAA